MPKEKEKLQARLAFLLDEAEDLWYGKRGEHSHINPIFKEYWRLVDIARQLYKGNYIFDDLDISEATQPNADDIQANIIVEGANNPTTLEADDMLRERGVFIVPDILANAGGVTVSYFEWVQDVQKYFWTENEVVARLREIMIRAFEDVSSIATRESVDMRSAALIKGIRKVADAKLVRGIFP